MQKSTLHEIGVEPDWAVDGRREAYSDNVGSPVAELEVPAGVTDTERFTAMLRAVLSPAPEEAFKGLVAERSGVHHRQLLAKKEKLESRLANDPNNAEIVAHLERLRDDLKNHGRLGRSNRVFNTDQLLEAVAGLSGSSPRPVEVIAGASAIGKPAPGALFFPWWDRPALTVSTLQGYLSEQEREKVRLRITAFGGVYANLYGFDSEAIMKNHQLQRAQFDLWLKTFNPDLHGHVNYFGFEGESLKFRDVRFPENWFNKNLTPERKAFYINLARRANKNNPEVLEDPYFEKKALQYVAWHLCTDHAGGLSQKKDSTGRIVVAGASDLPFVEDGDWYLDESGFYLDRPAPFSSVVFLNGVHAHSPGYNGPRTNAGEPHLEQIARGLGPEEITGLKNAIDALPEGRWATIRIAALMHPELFSRQDPFDLEEVPSGHPTRKAEFRERANRKVERERALNEAREALLEFLTGAELQNELRNAQ